MLIFVDFEASSLSPASWPIEIGLAWIDADGEVRSEGRLIQPDPGWPEDDWSFESAAIHRIPRRVLHDVEPAELVAQRAVEIIGDATLVSDAPEFDQRWLDRLLATLPDAVPPIIRDMDAIIGAAFPTTHPNGWTAIRTFFRELDRRTTPHRAEEDARRLAEAFAIARRAMDAS